MKGYYKDMFLKWKVNTGFTYYFQVKGEIIYKKYINDYGTIVRHSIIKNMQTKGSDLIIQKYAK